MPIFTTSSKDGIDQMLEIGRMVEVRLERYDSDSARAAREDLATARDALTRARDKVSNLGAMRTEHPS